MIRCVANNPGDRLNASEDTSRGLSTCAIQKLQGMEGHRRHSHGSHYVVFRRQQLGQVEYRSVSPDVETDNRIAGQKRQCFYPGGKNSAVQLGSYREMVFGRDPDNKIAFEYRWSLPESLKIADPLSGQEFAGDALAFEAEVGLGEGKRRSLSLDRLKI